MGGDMDPTNPYDPPERQTLEEQLYHDQQLQSADHQGVLSERHIIDAANAAGVKHEGDDKRLGELEFNEQLDASRVTRDQQKIDDWDQAHPGWENHLDQYQPAPAADPSAPDDSQYTDQNLYASADPQPAEGYDGSDAYASDSA